MNLRHLEHLIALAEEKSFARASEKIHLSQPALTRSIQTLEEDLGMQLCERLPRGTVLTPAGKMVVERAKRVLFESRALDRDVKLFRAHDIGEVSIGFGPYPAVLLLADVLAALAQSHPGLSVRAAVDNAATLLEHLHAEKLDFFVAERRAITPVPELAMQLLPPHRCGWFARPDHPVFQSGSIAVSKLREARLGTVPLGPYILEKLRRGLRYSTSETMHFHVECNDLSALKKLATQSDTVIFAPALAVQQELANGSLLEIALEYQRDFVMDFTIYRLAYRTVSPVTEKAIATLLKCDRLLRRTANVPTEIKRRR